MYHQDLCVAVNDSRMRGGVRACERGSLLIEIIIVMVLLGIVMAMGVYQFKGVDKVGYLRMAQEVGRTYYQAFQQFQQDHGGKLPEAPTTVGTTDWITTAMPNPNYYYGPIDGQKQPYLHTQQLNQKVLNGEIELIYLTSPNAALYAIPTSMLSAAIPNTSMSPPTKAMAAVIIHTLPHSSTVVLPDFTVDIWVRKKKNAAWTISDLRCTISDQAAASSGVQAC